MKLTIPKADVIVLIDLLTDFEELCRVRGVKFNRYTPEQIMEFLTLYKNYRAGKIDPPPF